MSWTKTSENGYLVATEELTMATGASTDVASSIIDFIPAGTDFTVLVNLDATNLAADADLDVYVAKDKDDTFADLKADLVGSMDQAVKAATYDVSSYGEAPYYKLVVDPDGNENGESVKIAIIVRA